MAGYSYHDSVLRDYKEALAKAQQHIRYDHCKLEWEYARIPATTPAQVLEQINLHYHITGNVAHYKITTPELAKTYLVADRSVAGILADCLHAYHLPASTRYDNPCLCDTLIREKIWWLQFNLLVELLYDQQALSAEEIVQANKLHSRPQPLT